MTPGRAPRVGGILLLILVCLVPVPGQAQRLIQGSRVMTGTFNYCADGGSTDAYACTLLETISAYTTGALYTFRANTANTGAATLNLNGLGAKTIKKLLGGTTADLVTGDILAGQMVRVQYDGTNMQLMSPPGALPALIASGSKTLDTTTIATGTCGTAQTATAIGTLTTDLVLASFHDDVTAITGYTPVMTGALRIDIYPTTDTMNFKVCNGTLADITPGAAITLNWRVLR